jgi:alkylresorcinol/alkylpyrone synthase
MMRDMARLNSVSSVVAAHRVDIADTIRFVSAHAPEPARMRLRRSLEDSGNRSRHTVLPLDRLTRLQGAAERGTLYRHHATHLGEQAVARLADMRTLEPGSVSTIVFVSSTGWAAPSIDTNIVRRFGLRADCRRIPLTQLGCAGGVAALALAAEISSRDPDERVLVVSAEVPSLHLDVSEPSYWELLSSAQFADGAAAAIVSSDEKGPEILGTKSLLLPEIDEGGRIIQCDTGLRLSATGGLPRLIRSRVRELVSRFASESGIDMSELVFVLAHPRGRPVLDAVADGLSTESAKLEHAYAAWEESGNMVSASIYRAFVRLVESGRPRSGDVGMLLAFGTGVACEMILLRWSSLPNVAVS